MACCNLLEPQAPPYMEEAIRCTVATLQLLEPLHWVWRDGERSEEEVATALRIQEEARRRAARRLEAWRLEAAREWEHARQRGLWFRHWEGVEGRRIQGGLTKLFQMFSERVVAFQNAVEPAIHEGVMY